MTVNFGVCTDDPSKINKTFTQNHSASCEVKENTGVVHPTLIVKYSSISPTDNYVEIPDFGRKYFIHDIIYTTGDRAEVILTPDPMGSAADALNGKRFYLARVGTQAKRAADVTDSNYPISNNCVITNIVFGENTFPDLTGDGDEKIYVLTVAGGDPDFSP